MQSGAGPHVGLDFFSEEDAPLFFGRSAERKRIITNLRASRLTLLYASSGGGKSSLLRAGRAARPRQGLAPAAGLPAAPARFPVRPRPERAGVRPGRLQHVARGPARRPP